MEGHRTSSFRHYDENEPKIFSKMKQGRRNVQTDVTASVEEDEPLLQVSSTSIGVGSRPSTSGLKLFLLCVCCVLFNVMMNVSLPVFAGTMEVIGGDTLCVLLYGAMFFPIMLVLLSMLLRATIDKTISLKPTSTLKVYLLMGITVTLNGILVVFASPPSRTAPYLQGVLATTLIPFTVLCRFLMLRKGISRRRLGCTAAVLIGIFITVEPQIWSLPGTDNSGGGGTTTGHIVWPMIFALGFLPAAVNNVLCERELKQGEAQSLSFITWTQVFQFLTILPLFWVDFIPFFGMASSFDDFGHRLHRGFKCNFSSADDCNGLAFKGWIFILGYCLANLFVFLLIQCAEGAIFAVVVQSMVTPIATLFWTFFTFDAEQNHFYWDPRFTETTGFTIVGLVIIVPSVVMYNLFSRWDAKEAEAKSKERSEVA